MTTWDGKPISPEKPHGVTIVVFRRTAAGLEFLVLHRSYEGPEAEGDWAWTPPSGARFPGEDVDACAVRELEEETGLVLAPGRISERERDWWVYLAEAPVEAAIQLSIEHDRFAWLSAEEAVSRCLPAMVGEQIRAAVNAILGS